MGILDAPALLKDRVATKTVALSGTPADYTCNANTNDQSSTSQTIINTAFTALSSAGGGTLKLRAGTYYIKTPGIRIPSNCTLEGEGNSTILVYATGSGNQGMIANSEFIVSGQVNTNTGIRIANLYINGNSVNATGSNQNMIVLALCSDSIVENVHIYDAPHAGIVLDVDTHDCIVRNNIIDTTSDIGIYSSSPYNCIVEGNIIRNTASYGIRVIRRTSTGGCKNNSVLNNKVNSCGSTNQVAGIMIDQADITNVVGNQVRESGTSGIQLENCAYITVTGNQIMLAGTHGIYCHTASRSTVSGNGVYASSQNTGNVSSGIQIHDSSTIVVSGNRSGDGGSGTRQKYGISELGTSDNNLVVGNMVAATYNATAGLNILGANTEYAMNHE